MRDPEVVEGPTRPILPAIRPRFLPSSPPRRSSRPLAVSGYHPSYSQPTDHPTQSRPGTPVSPSVHVGAFLRFAQPKPHGRRRHRIPRAPLSSRCRECSARQVRGRLCCRIGGAAAGSHAVRGDWPSSPPSPLPLPLPFKLLRRHHRARARGAARRHAMGGYYRDRDRCSDRDRRPADREESSDLRRRSGGAARCSAVTRDGGGCGMAAAAARGCHAAVRVVVALA